MASSASIGRLVRSLVFALVFAIVATVGLLAVSPARAAFNDLRVQPGQYTGTNLYVPGETMAITVEAASGDVFDIEIYHWVAPFGSRTRQTAFDDEAIPASGERTVTWIIPTDMEDSIWYWVTVYDSDYFESMIATTTYESYLFEIRGYDFATWLDRSRYIPGDTITVGWSVTLVRDGSPAPAGVGEIQASNGPASLLPTPYTFTASQGSFPFDLSTAEDPNRVPFVRIWFNDTSGSRLHEATLPFDIGFFDLVLSVAATFPPGGVVTIDVWAKAAATAGTATISSPGVTGAVVNITIRDVDTGATTGYGASGLLSGSEGRVVHVFRLAATPTSAVYDVQVQGTAHGTFTQAESDTFEVRATTAFLVQLVIDRTEYVSGETAAATASANPAGANYTYGWRVWDPATGAILFQQSTGESTLAFPIPANFTGALSFTVTVDDGEGNRESATRAASVAYGYLAVNFDPFYFSAGDTLTASYSFRSVAMANPSFFYEVWDAEGNLARSGNLTTSSVTYTTPPTASSFYQLIVTATDGGRTVSGSAISNQAALFFLSLTLDRASYLPGETIRVGYALTGQGPVSWPSVLRINANLAGSGLAFVSTTSRSGELGLRVPEGTNEGDLLLFAIEFTTGASAFETVHIGSTNPLWTTDVAGIPTFAVILAILLALLAVGFVYLWRKVAMSGLPSRARVEKATPPPPPPAAPRGPSASPMSVACRNCNATIDITTSKRPIEVMCPSCGETQLVQ